eukprot:TCONS_00061607-protein
MPANKTHLITAPSPCNGTTDPYGAQCVDNKGHDLKEHWFRCFDHSPENIIRNSIIGTVLLAISALGTLSNLFICLVVFKFKIYKNTQEMLILLLAISDFFISLFLISTESVLFLCMNPIFQATIPICRPYDIFYIFVTMWDTILPISCFVVMFMSIERFLAIRFPFKIRQIKRRYIVLGYVMAWVYTFGASVVGYLTHYPGWIRTMVLNISNILPLLINSMVYVYIQRLVYKHSKAINRQRVSVVKQSTVVCHENRQSRGTYKKNVLFLYVAVSFFVFWLPFICYEIAFIMNPTRFDSCTYITQIILSCLVYLNSIGNVFIYGASSKPYRKAYWRFMENFCCKICSEKSSTVNPIEGVSLSQNNLRI